MCLNQWETMSVDLMIVDDDADVLSVVELLARDEIAREKAGNFVQGNDTMHFFYFN